MLSLSTLSASLEDADKEGEVGVGVSYKSAKLAETWDAIVIGSGMGGMSAAMLLAELGGKRVLVLERHYEAGGFTHTFHRPGYEWDVGLHYIGQMQQGSMTRRAFDHVTSGKLQWHAMPEVYDRAFIAGESFDFVAGAERLRDSLTSHFPREVIAIDRYLAAIRACNRFNGLYFAEKALPARAAAIVGGLMRVPFMRWAKQTTRGVLEKITANRELIGVLTSQWGDYGLPPARSSFAVHAGIVGHYLDGASYPVGGASAIAKAIVPRIEDGDGCVVTSAEVQSIVIEKSRAAGVRMTDGREFRSAMVLSDVGAATTFGRLLPLELPALGPLRARLRNLQPSTAHICLYVGLSNIDAALGIDAANQWIYPSFDHDANVERFEQDLDAAFPGVYLSFPSAKDPDFQRRYPGKATVEVISMCSYEGFARWGDTQWKRRGERYEALKQRLADRLRGVLEHQVPSVVGNIACMELSTPVTTRHFANQEHGEIYGFAYTPERYALRELGARTPIRDLYLTGQDVASLGVVGALFGGVASASAALGRNLFTAVSRPKG